MNIKKIYIIGIGGIGISAIARYCLAKGYNVYGSDICGSELITKLKSEGIKITIGENSNLIDNSFDLVIYTEAIPINQIELKKAITIGLKVLTYPKSLKEITKGKKLITIAGTHGKSTTSSLTSIVFKNSDIDFTSIVGTLLKEFDNKNFFYRKNNSEDEYFILEACEYNRSFLNYKPTVGIITNIELDHLDYFKDLEDYLSAFKDYINNIIPGGFAILNGNDKNCQTLFGLRDDIDYINVFEKSFVYNEQEIFFPIINIKIPGNHILFDAHISYIIGYMIGIPKSIIVNSLCQYSGVWRRMETIGITVHNNILMSDYGHHPTEISLTLKSIKENNIDKKILTIFQPHQYSRTLELIDDFKNCFIDTDKLIIPNIYESRDSEIDKKKINSKKLIELINHKDKTDGNGLENTLKIIKEFDKNNTGYIIILMGAGDIDNLRYKIKTV